MPFPDRLRELGSSPLPPMRIDTLGMGAPPIREGLAMMRVGLSDRNDSFGERLCS